jgi:hypothetical protein
MEDMSIRTPETHPNDPVVGKNFRAWDSGIYFCDSYDPSCGYWMTLVGCLLQSKNSELPAERRTNVSERAIGGTFHKYLWFDANGRPRE